MALIVTRGGEPPKTMSDENYVRTCMVLANTHDGNLQADEIQLNSYRSIRNNRITRALPGSSSDEQALRSARTLRPLIRSELLEAMRGRPMSASRRDAMSKLLDEGVEVITDLALLEDGSIVHLHRYIPHTDDAAVALLRAFIYKLQARLLTCPLNGCGHFFLHDSTHRKYCSPEHTLAADANRSPARQQKLRDKRNAEARKHQ